MLDGGGGDRGEADPRHLFWHDGEPIPDDLDPMCLTLDAAAASDKATWRDDVVAYLDLVASMRLERPQALALDHSDARASGF